MADSLREDLVTIRFHDSDRPYALWATNWGWRNSWISSIEICRL